MTSRDRIVVLLDHYRVVCIGIPGIEPRGDDMLALMCEEWNHPSYQQLEMLLRLMHERWPWLRQALRTRYERYWEHRVAWCAACNGYELPSHIDQVHVRGVVAGKKLYCRRGAQTVTLVPRTLRVLPPDDDPHAVGEALEWLERHWQGDVGIPDAVFKYTTAMALREVA